MRKTYPACRNYLGDIKSIFGQSLDDLGNHRVVRAGVEFYRSGSFDIQSYRGTGVSAVCPDVSGLLVGIGDGIGNYPVADGVQRLDHFSFVKHERSVIQIPEMSFLGF